MTQIEAPHNVEIPEGLVLPEGMMLTETGQIVAKDVVASSVYTVKPFQFDSEKDKAVLEFKAQLAHMLIEDNVNPSANAIAEDVVEAANMFRRVIHDAKNREQVYQWQDLFIRFVSKGNSIKEAEENVKTIINVLH